MQDDLSWSTKCRIIIINESTFFRTGQKPADLLLGMTISDIFEKYWPEHAESWRGINSVTKYVLSTTRNNSNWKNTVFIESLASIKKLKNTEGSDIQVGGSGKLVQLLLENDLVDELSLKIYPLTLGEGKKLFENGTRPAAFTLTASSITPSGVIIANYKRAGKIKTGTVGA